MTKLSVNINKIALIRNSRGTDKPNLVQVAKDCERFGAQGITIHPRPDERHARFRDVFDLKEVVTTELNIEGNPGQHFMDVVLKAKPHQVTLVPDAEDAITSNEGWNTIYFQKHLTDLVSELKKAGIRTSIFVDANVKMIEAAATTGTDRVELYTEPYAEYYHKNRQEAIKPFMQAAEAAKKSGLGLNAGHDLNLDNLQYLKENIPYLDEVSIGHALVIDALYFGLENVIGMYLRKLLIVD